MDEYLVYFAPILIVGFGVMLAAFVSDSWPDWLVRFVSLCAEMANGVWVAGIAMVLLIGIGLPTPLAALASLPVMYYSGRYLAGLFERIDDRTREIKLNAWKAHRKKEIEKKETEEHGEL
jgi:hypothetical protein